MFVKVLAYLVYEYISDNYWFEYNNFAYLKNNTIQYLTTDYNSKWWLLINIIHLLQWRKLFQIIV